MRVTVGLAKPFEDLNLKVLLQVLAADIWRQC